MSQFQPEIIVFVEGDFTKLEGGPYMRMLEQIRFLHQSFSGVTVYSFYENFLTPWTEESVVRFSHLLPGVNLVLEHLTPGLKIMMRIKNLAIMLSANSARRISNWRLKGATPRFDDLVASTTRPVLVSNFVDGVTLLNGTGNLNILIDTHDIKFILVTRRQNFETFHSRILIKLRRELIALSLAKAVISISFAEKTFFSLMLPSVRQFYIPSFQLSPGDLNAIKKGKSLYKYDLLFVGSLNEFNPIGISEFCITNLSWLKNRTIAIAGRVCQSERVKSLKEVLPNLVLLGFIDDLSILYAETKAALSPVGGAGLKIKVLDALSTGTPVFASDHSREGLPSGYEDCVFPTDRTIIESLLDDQASLERAEQAARKYSNMIVEMGEKSQLVEFLKNIVIPASGEAST